MSQESESLPEPEALVSNDLMRDLDSKESSNEEAEERYLDYNYNSNSYGYPALSPYYQQNSAQLLRQQLLLKQQLARQQLAMQRNQQLGLMNTANSFRNPQARQGLAYGANRYFLYKSTVLS